MTTELVLEQRRGMPIVMPCQVCGETIGHTDLQQNTVRALHGHNRGLHHVAHEICDRRVAEGWLPLTSALRTSALYACWADGFQPNSQVRAPLESEGVWCPGKSGRIRTVLCWARVDDLYDLVERDNRIAYHGAAAAELRHLERAATRCNRFGEPWWIAWRKSHGAREPFLKVATTFISNEPRGTCRGDLTP